MIKKEGFWSGKAEVYRYVQHLNGCNASTTVATTGLTGVGVSINKLDQCIQKVSNSCLRKEFTPPFNLASLAVYSFPIENNHISELREFTENMALLIYEYDPGSPKNFKPCSNTGVDMQFNSVQTPYFQGSFDWVDLPDTFGSSDYQNNPINDSKGADGCIFNLKGFRRLD